MYGVMETYRPPHWAAGLSFVPKKRIQLAVANTPIHPWKVPGVPEDFSVSVKRDDLTGAELSGNKVRRLEFIMAEAVDQGCSHVITTGVGQSNHCRAFALSARRLGLTPHLFLTTHSVDRSQQGCEANMLLNRLCGAHVYLLPQQPRCKLRDMPKMQQLAEQIKSSTGESSYVVPRGGTCTAGLFGCVSVFEEFKEQGVLEQFDDLVVACGSGGTVVGLAIANYLTGGHLRLHGFVVANSVQFFYNHLGKTLQEVGLGHLNPTDMVRVIGGYKGLGYAISTDEELQFLQQVAEKTSIVLDPTYGAKTVLGMVKEMQTNPSEFKGRRVLYLHTGGIFSLFDGRMAPVLEKKEEQQPCIKVWPQVDDFP